MRPIDADELKITLTDWIRLHWDEAFTADDMAYDFLEMINEELTLKMKPVVHAHWVPQHPNNRTGKAYTFVCSNCKKFAIRSRQASIDELGYVFCPNCGAKMNERKTNEYSGE